MEPQHRNSIDFAGLFDRPTATRSATAAATHPVAQWEPRARCRPRVRMRVNRLIEQPWRKSQGAEPRDIGVRPKPIPRPRATCKATRVISRSEHLLYSEDPATESLCPSTHPSGVRQFCASTVPQGALLSVKASSWPSDQKPEDFRPASSGAAGAARQKARRKGERRSRTPLANTIGPTL